MKMSEYRSFESFDLIDQAFKNHTGDFENDLISFCSWCVNNYYQTKNHRETQGLPSESFGKAFADIALGSEPYDLSNLVRNFILPEKQKWSWLYKLLQDIDSKKTLINIMAYRCLGWRYVPMALDNPNAWSTLERLQAIASNYPIADRINIDFFGMELTPFSLDDFGYEINLLATNGCVFSEILYSQYNYRGYNFKVAPGDGDIVLDCGACHGATSLFFANQIGKLGKVFSFEFFPENIKVFQKNLEINPLLKEKITLIEAPVWEEDNTSMEVRGVGPATRVVLLNTQRYISRIIKKSIDSLTVAFYLRKNKKYSEKYRFLVKAVSIDAECRRRNMKSVNFIKMDIEGAELSALMGAKQTITQHKPTLAICVYHSLKDFYEIPEFITKLDLGYQFYLQHSTVHGDETVLFAQVPHD